MTGVTQFGSPMKEPIGQNLSNQDCIVIRSPDGSQREVVIQAVAKHPGRTELIIGRSASADITLADPKASRQHTKITFDGTTYSVSDLGSTNGTFLANAKLLPGIPQEWTPDKPLRIGDHWLVLQRGSQAAEHLPEAAGAELADAASQGAASPQATGAHPSIAVSMETTHLTVEPGGAVIPSLTILNQGTEVDHFQVVVAGVPAAWLPETLPTVRLMPGQQQPISFTLRPPRAPTSHAGDYPLTVRVASRDSPQQVAEVSAKLTVNPYRQINAQFKSDRLYSGKTGSVIVQNQGNSDESCELAWSDPAGDVIFNPARCQVAVPPGQEAATTFQAAIRRRQWIGGAKSHAFSVQASFPPALSQTLQGTFFSRGLIPVWLPPLLLLALVSLALLLRSLIVQPPVIDRVWFEPANPQVGQAITVFWEVRNAQRIELSPFGYEVAPEQNQYTFAEGFAAPPNLTLVASNRFGNDRMAVPIVPIVPTPTPAPTATPTQDPGEAHKELWEVSPKEIFEGESVKLEWRVTNADSVTLDPLGTVESQGSVIDIPRQTGTKAYTLIATRAGKMARWTQEVVVKPKPITAPDIKTFTVTPDHIVAGEVDTVLLAWETEKADTVIIEPDIGAVASVGSRDVPAPRSDREYTLVARNAGEIVSTRRIQLKVTAASCSVSVSNVILRSGPGAAYDTVGSRLASNDDLEPLVFSATGYPSGQWIQVRVPGRATGWIDTQNVSCNLDVTKLPAPSTAPVPPFMVTQVSVNVNPPSFSGACPVVLRFEATITTNAAGAVRYQWERGDGVAGAVQTVEFAAPGARTVDGGTWNLKAAGTYWKGIRVLSPNEMLSKEAKFTLACATSSATSPGPLLFIDALAQPGRIERLDSDGVTTFYTRPSGAIHSIARASDGSIYFCDSSKRQVLRLQNGVESVYYTHDTYVKEVAISPSGGVYFSSETQRPSYNGIIYLIKPSTQSGRLTAEEFYAVRRGDNIISWDGNFAFDRRGDLWLSSERSLYQVVNKVVQRKYFSRDGSVLGFFIGSNSDVFYADGRSMIHRVIISPASSVHEVVQSIPAAQQLKDIVPTTR